MFERDNSHLENESESEASKDSTIKSASKTWGKLEHAVTLDVFERNFQKANEEDQETAEELEKIPVTGDIVKDGLLFIKTRFKNDPVNLRGLHFYNSKQFPDGDPEKIYNAINLFYSNREDFEDPKENSGSGVAAVWEKHSKGTRQLSSVLGRMARKIIDAYHSKNLALLEQKTKELSQISITGDIAQDSKKYLNKMEGFSGFSPQLQKEIDLATKSKDNTKIYDLLKKIIKQESANLAGSNVKFRPVKTSQIDTLKNIVDAYEKKIVPN